MEPVEPNIANCLFFMEYQKAIYSSGFTGLPLYHNSKCRCGPVDNSPVFPTKAIADLAKRGVKGFLSAELNAGQMVQDVKLAVNGAAPVEHYGRQGGMMFSPDEVLVALKVKLINKK